jgi:hypothetical protein
VNLIEVLTGANVALKLLQERLVLILALLLTAGIFSWAMLLQTVLGAIIASVWGLSIFLPVLFTGQGAHHGKVSEDPAQHPAGETQQD